MVGSLNTSSKYRPYISQHLSIDGTGFGTLNANGDYSGATQDFYILPPPKRVYYITRLLVFVEDSIGFHTGEYGNIGGPLANGITVEVRNASELLLDLTKGVKIQTNSDWTRHCYDTEVRTWGAGNEYLAVRWTFARAGTTVRLRGNLYERLTVRLNDDLSSLMGHFFVAQGWQE